MPIKATVPMFYFHYRGSKIAGAHSGADDNYTYPFYHEDHTKLKWEISFQNGNDWWTFKWPYNTKADLDRDGMGYSLPAMSPDVAKEFLEKWLKPYESGTRKAQLTLEAKNSKVLFTNILKGLSSKAADETNFAAPDPAKIGSGPITAIEESAIRSMYHEVSKTAKPMGQTFRFKHLDCSIGMASKEPFFGTAFLVFKVEIVPPTEIEMTRLVALDWSELEKHGKKGVTDPTLKSTLTTWSSNVMQYFLNYTNLSRGKKTLDSIVKRGIKLAAEKTTSIQTLAKYVEDQVDARLITANAWDYDREKESTEMYQHVLQEKVGSITKTRPSAGPIPLFRQMKKAVNAKKAESYTVEDVVTWVLQSGLAHCGEHASVAFLILKRIMDTGNFPTAMAPIIRCAQARVDHAMVLVGILPAELELRTFKSTNPNYNKSGKNDVTVFDLELSLKKDKREGTVCDAYLDKNFRKAKDLLKAIKSTSKYLQFHEMYPPNGTVFTIPIKPASTPKKEI